MIFLCAAERLRRSVVPHEKGAKKSELDLVVEGTSGPSCLVAFPLTISAYTWENMAHTCLQCLHPGQLLAEFGPDSDTDRPAAGTYSVPKPLFSLSLCARELEGSGRSLHKRWR